MRFFIDFDSSMDESLVGMLGGATNFFLIIGGLVIVFMICIYFLNNEFNKTKTTTHTT